MEEELKKIATALTDLEEKIIAKNAETALKFDDVQKKLKNTGSKYLNLRASAGSALKQLDSLIAEIEKEN